MIKINRRPLSQSGGGTHQTENLRDTRNFYELQPGERFKATITDIKPGLVTIRLGNGGTFTARIMVLPDARIGDESFFVVRENNQRGQISLEMVRPGLETHQSVIVREALIHAGLFVSEENIALGKALLDNGLPMDAATLQKAAFFRYAQEDMTTERAIFLLREDIPADMDAVQRFAELFNKPHYLHTALHRILTALTLTTGGVDSSAVQDTHKQLRKQLFLLLDQSPSVRASTSIGTSPLHRYYNDLLSFLGKNEHRLEELGLRHDIPEMLRRMEQISHHRAYYQIPFITAQSDATRQAELFVFKDGKGKDKRELAQQANVLVALDTSAMGRVEAYTQKNGKSLSIQFRCGTDGVLHTLKDAAPLLTRALHERGFTVAALGFDKTDRAFTLTDATPDAGRDEEKQKATPKRYLFDMRV